MSVINRMLQELDRRQGLAVDGAAPAPEVRAVAAPITREREWFWRLVATLMVAALCWVGWVAWQLQPRELVTEKAILAAEDARRGSAAAAADAEAAKEQSGTVPREVRAEAGAVQAEPMRPATAPETPPAPREPAKPAPKLAAEAAQVPPAPSSQAPVATPGKPAAAPSSTLPPAAQAGRLGLDLPQARIIAPPVAPSGRVIKQTRVLTTSEKAEAEFRRAVALLGQGRGSDADESFAAAIAIDPAHEAARQALVALRLEGRRVDDARRLLQEGLAINPANVQFATVLARIFAERRDYATALETMQGAAGAAATGNADYQVLRATILQRLKRHADAVDAYQAALRLQGLNAPAWIGLGISLEALGKRAEAAQSFRHALEVGALPEDLRAFAEQRERALR
jgi:MSHA biogenesis protein MshN